MGRGFGLKWRRVGEPHAVRRPLVTDFRPQDVPQWTVCNGREHHGGCAKLGKKRHPLSGPVLPTSRRIRDDLEGMFDLIRAIERGLAVKGMCHVCDRTLDQIWPVKSPADRDRQRPQIEAFAFEHRWEVVFRDGEPGAVFLHAAGLAINSPARRR